MANLERGGTHQPTDRDRAVSTPRWASWDWRAVSERLREGWEQSPLSGFLNWWWRELAGCLPASIKRKFKATDLRPVLRWPLSSDATVGPARAITLLLDPAQVLECDVQLPRMPKNALAKVMAHEIDRYTPFTRDEVYFSVRAPGSTLPGAPMDVQLTVITRGHLDGIVHKALELGIEVASVDVIDSHGQPQGIDLLPASVSVLRDKRAGVIRHGLLASAVILALVCMSTWVQRSEHALEVRRAQLADIRASALQVDAMRKQLQARSEVERALRLREAQRLGSVALLDLLTRCVPEQTWLDSLRVDAEGQLVLTGTSSRASALPAHMSECAGLLKAGLQGGIQPEPATGRERFTMHARLRGGE